MIMKNKFLIICSVALATLFLACSKDSTNSNDNNSSLTLTDSCRDCDRMKQMILDDPDLEDKYVDSLFCDDNNLGKCSILRWYEKLGSLKINPVLSEVFCLTLKNHIEQNLFPEYNEVYYECKPNADTPFMGPLFFAFNSIDGTEKPVVIKGYIDEYLYYYDPENISHDINKEYLNPIYIPANRYNPYNNRISQHNDTFRFNAFQKFVYLDGVKTKFIVYHTFIRSSDHKTMRLKAEFYSNSLDRQNGLPPKFVSTNYLLKKM